MERINPCIPNLSDFIEFTSDRFSKLNVYNCEFINIDEFTHVNLYSLLSSYISMFMIQYCDDKLLRVTFVSHVGISQFFKRLLYVCEKLDIILS